MWKPAAVVKRHDSPRSYIVESGGHEYRRNLRYLRRSTEAANTTETLLRSRSRWQYTPSWQRPVLLTAHRILRPSIESTTGARHNLPFRRAVRNQKWSYNSLSWKTWLTEPQTEINYVRKCVQSFAVFFFKNTVLSAVSLNLWLLLSTWGHWTLTVEFRVVDSRTLFYCLGRFHFVSFIWEERCHVCRRYRPAVYTCIACSQYGTVK